MQLNNCNVEITSLEYGSLSEYDAVRFKESMDYLLNVSQDPQLQDVVR